MATQKAIKITRTAMSLHFLFCLMIPPKWAVPSLEGYLPMTAPKGPLILKPSYICMYFFSQLQATKLWCFSSALQGEMQTNKEGTEVE